MAAVDVSIPQRPERHTAGAHRQRGPQRPDLRYAGRLGRHHADAPAQDQSDVSTNQQVIVDIQTARADVQQFGINASYSLIEKATGKPVITGDTFARVSYDNPGQAQRFSNARGQRDAENRALAADFG